MAKRVLPFLFLLSVSLVFSQSSIKKISGFVTDGLNPIENVSVVIKDTDQGVKTEKDGSYSLYAEEGQTLVYSYVGKLTMEIIVEDVTTFLNITMHEDIEQLSEVVVTKRKKRTRQALLDEYHTNKNLVKTAFGIMDKERSGFSMRVVDGDQLNFAGLDFIDALQAWIPGIQVFRPTTFRPGGGALSPVGRAPTDLTIPIVYLPRAIRSFARPVPPAFDVDGVIYTDAPIFIPVQNIERIAVMESIGATNRYGTLGVGGVIIINTKWGNPQRKEPGTNKPFDQAKLRDNIFDASTLTSWSQIPVPNYLETLHNAKDGEEAQAIFENLETSYPQSPYFYLDGYTFFKDKYDNKPLRESIAKTIERKFGMNPTVLKALAYLLEEEKEFEKAMELYKTTFIMRPHYVQSYMDLANVYQNLGEVEDAAMLYARYNYLIEESFFETSEDFTPIMHKDFRNLLEQNRNVLGSKYTLESDGYEFKGTRIVFEWNDSEAEFELQFVSPENKYFTSSHSLIKNPERIHKEKLHGFSCEEYLIYEPINGDWNINIKYLGNKSATPTFLKTTIYSNFGGNNQKKEIRVFKLATKNANLALLRLHNGRSTPAN